MGIDKGKRLTRPHVQDTMTGADEFGDGWVCDFVVVGIPGPTTLTVMAADAERVRAVLHPV
jgi:hypothetical protein